MGLVSVENNSTISLYTGSSIEGNTTEGWVDPNTGIRYDTLNEAQLINPEISNEHLLPGDRLEIDNSLLNIDSGASVTNISGSNRWDGITIRNCGEFINPVYPYDSSVSHIMGSISNVNEIEVDNSIVEFTQSEIYNCGQLRIINGSDVTIDHSDYHSNDCGIYAEESRTFVQYSNIYSNQSNGLSINYPSIPPGLLYESEIYNNVGNGLELRNSIFSIIPSARGSWIHDNTRYGYLNLSTASSSIYGGTQIYNNGSSEVLSMYDCFPIFANPTYIALPNVGDDNGFDPNTFDKYLLAVVGLPQNQTVNVSSLAVKISDNTRFYPSFSSYLFGEPQASEAEILFSCALDSIYTQAYEAAYDMMKYIGSDFSETVTAKKAIPYLPYLCKAIDGDPNELFLYLTDIDELALQEVKLEAISVSKLANGEYEEAIAYLEQIIQDPPSDEKELLAELDQAFCYYKLVTSGSKNLPAQCKYKPQSSSEYMQIRNSIMNNFTDVNSAVEAQPLISSNILISNYPNPFNPCTTLSFALSCDMLCKLEIYNIRGQVVKTLMDEQLSAGNQSIVWNGTDENGSSVSSGVYFYKLSTPKQTQTSKMLLMK